MIWSLIIRSGIQQGRLRGRGQRSRSRVCVGRMSATESARWCLPFAVLIRTASSWSKVTLFCRCCWLDKNVRLRFSGCIMRWLFTHMGHGWQVCKHSVWANINKFFFLRVSFELENKSEEFKKREEKSKEKDDQSQKDAFELLWEGKIRLSASCRWTLQKTFPACSAPPHWTLLNKLFCIIYYRLVFGFE